MASASISGLSSGLDTASIIEQFMKLEAVPQTRLKSQVTSEQSVITALQALNAKLATLATKAKELSSADAWGTLAVTSSSTAVTAKATDAASPGELTITVLGTAKAHQLASSIPGVALTDQVTGASNTVNLVLADGTVEPVTTTDGSLQSLVSAINARSADTGVRATTVKSTDGYKLLLEATTTGAAGTFSITAEDGTDLALMAGHTSQAGSDATISLGAVTVSSATNTFTDLIPGVSVTLAPTAKANDVAQVTVSRDGTTRADAIKSLVDSINTVLTDVASLTSYNSANKTAGKLQGDTGVREVARKLVDAIYPGDGTSMATFGIEVDRYGKLTFDADEFKKAYADDPAATTAAFTGTGSFASRIEKVAEAASDKYTGSITSAINGRTQGIERLQDSIERWDLRLELRRTTLTRQFTALETALNQMNSQSSWLAGQIGSLPKTS